MTGFGLLYSPDANDGHGTQYTLEIQMKTDVVYQLYKGVGLPAADLIGAERTLLTVQDDVAYRSQVPLFAHMPPCKSS